jgi:hypothetical protein
MARVRGFLSVHRNKIEILKALLIGALIGIGITVITAYLLEATGKTFFNMVIVYFVVGVLLASGYHVLKNWSFIVDVEKKVSISAQIFTVSVAAVMGLVVLRTNREDAHCLRLLTEKNAVTELLREVTYQVQDKIGVPENCFNTKGATVSMQATPEGIRNHQEYATNVNLLHERIYRFPAFNKPLEESFSRYSDARFELEKQCGERNEEFKKIYDAVRPAELDLMNQLNLAIGSCLQL